MKVLFVGPSLPDLQSEPTWPHPGGFGAGLVWRGPAANGDIARAVLEGATGIGLVDGFFERCAAVWHKEILFALQAGVHVLGAASMGALRAAECAAYGMVGIGTIFEQYASGQIEDDDAVAQLHAPAELGYLALTEPLVNIQATLQSLVQVGAISQWEAETLNAAAGKTFFKDRTFCNVVRSAGLHPSRSVLVAELLTAHRINLKEQDARELIAALQTLPAVRRAPPTTWVFNETNAWLRRLEAVTAH